MPASRWHDSCGLPSDSMESRQVDMKTKLLALVTLFGTALAGSAQAIDLTFAGMSLPNALTASISVNGSSFTSVYAGQLKFTSSSGSLSTYCADALSFLNSSSHSYTTSSLTLTPDTNLGKAATILSNNQAGALTAAQQAGLQLAIWEALYDGGTTFDASGAKFQAKGVSSEVLGFASSYYGSYCDPASNPVTHFGTNQSGGQSQMTAVPEPMTVAALGLGSLVLLRRRKRSA